MTLKISVSVRKEGKFYVARAVEIELASQGKTVDEALANLKEAFELWAEHADKEELEILQKDKGIITHLAIAE